MKGDNKYVNKLLSKASVDTAFAIAASVIVASLVEGYLEGAVLGWIDIIVVAYVTGLWALIVIFQKYIIKKPVVSLYTNLPPPPGVGS